MFYHIKLDEKVKTDHWMKEADWEQQDIRGQRTTLQPNWVTMKTFLKTAANVSFKLINLHDCVCVCVCVFFLPSYEGMHCLEY